MAHKRGLQEAMRGNSRSIGASTKKRRIEYTEADAALAEIFGRLASEIEAERIKAAAEIVKLYKMSRSSSEKILLRLIKGLCSSHKGARPGFFIALTEVLKATRDEPGILDKQNFAEALVVVMEKLKRETKVAGGVSSQEKRDHLIGRLTGYSALVHSTVLFIDDFKSYLDSILQEVWEISQLTSWLREQCGKVYFDIVAIAVSLQQTKPVNELLQFLKDKKLLKTPEGIAVWLEASKSTIDVQFPKHVWYHEDPLSPKERHLLANIMRDGTQNNSEEIGQPGKKSSGNRRDSPHFAWDAILSRFFGVLEQHAEATSEDSTSGTFEHFWLTVVDNVYFAPSASMERKALGLRMFSIVVSSGPIWACEQAMSPRLMNCIMNQRSKADRFLNQAANSVLDKLKQRAASEQTLARKIISAVIFKNGDEPERADADRIARGKSFINEVFENANDGVAECIVVEYERILFNPGVENQQESDTIRRVIADHLVAFVRLRKQTLSEYSDSPLGWRNMVIRTLFRCSCMKNLEEGYLTPFEPPIRDTSREIFKPKLLSCLKELLKTQAQGNIDLISSAVTNLASYGSKYFVELDRSERATEATSEALEMLKDMRKTERTAEKRTTAQLGAFKLLFSMAIIQACCGENEAVAILNDLKDCYENFKKRNQTQPGSSDAVIEIILGFCSNQSALYRTLSEQIFVSFAHEISVSSLQSLVHVLEQEENLAGQKELFKEQTGEESPRANGDSEVGEAEFEDSDVEVVDAASEGSSTVNDNTSASGGENEINEANEALDRALGQILQTQKPSMAGVNDPVDGADPPSSDESMDDEQMVALGIDNKLSAIFAQQVPQSSSRDKFSEKKRAQKDAKENMLNFKNRILGLLHIYVKQEHASPNALAVILPLLRLVGSTRSPQIGKKSSDLLDAYFKAAKSKGMPLSASSLEVWDILDDVHQEVLMYPSKLHASVSSRCSLFLARLLILQNEKEAMRKLIQKYASTHEDRFQTESKAPATFWTDFVNWSIAMGNEN